MGDRTGYRYRPAMLEEMGLQPYRGAHMVQDQPTWANDMYRKNGPLAKPFQGACADGVSFAAGIAHTHALLRY